MKGPAMRRAHKSESTFQQTGLSLNPPRSGQRSSSNSNHTFTVSIPASFHSWRSKRATSRPGTRRAPGTQPKEGASVRARARETKPPSSSVTHTPVGEEYIFVVSSSCERHSNRRPAVATNFSRTGERESPSRARRRWQTVLSDDAQSSSARRGSVIKYCGKVIIAVKSHSVITIVESTELLRYI